MVWMRSQFYAPLVGFAIVAIATLIAGSAFSQEKASLSFISSMTSDLTVLTYGEVVLFDVRASLDSFVRDRVYEWLQAVSVSSLREELTKRVPRWAEIFFEQFRIELPGLRAWFDPVPRFRARKLRRISDDMGAIDLSVVREGTLHVRSFYYETELPISGTLTVLLPFPFKKVEEAQRELEKKVRESLSCFKEINAGKGRVSRWLYDKCAEGVTPLGVKYAYVKEFLGKERKIPAEIGGIMTSVSFEWVPPGSNRKIEVKLLREAKERIKFFDTERGATLFITGEGNFLAEGNIGVCDVLEMCDLRVRCSKVGGSILCWVVCGGCRTNHFCRAVANSFRREIADFFKSYYPDDPCND